MTRQLRWRVALAALVALAVGAPAAEAADFRIASINPIDTLNPLGQQNELPYDLTSVAYDRLINFAVKDGAPDLRNSLARAYKVSPDGRVWTFSLHPGIRWSDGRPFTADDVVFTYRAIKENESNYLRDYLSSVRSVDAPDPLTVRLRLSEPDVRITSIKVPILPRHVFARIPIKRLDKIAWPLPAVTTAPFRYTTYAKTGTTILEPNLRFRGTRPRIGRILAIAYQDREAQLRDLELRKVDLIYQGSAQWLRTLKGEPAIKGWSSPAAGFKEMAFNSCPPGGAGTCTGPGSRVAVKVVQDPAIRQALAWGIDRDALSQTIYAGANRPARGLISPYFTRFYREWARDPDVGFRYDPARARRILAAGGWDCRSAPCVKGRVKAHFELLVRANDNQDKSAAKRIRAWAANLGIQIRVTVVSEDGLNNRILASGSRSGTYAPDYDAFYWNWTGDPTPDFNFEVLRTGSTWQDVFYSNAEYDSLVAQARQERDPARRADLLHRAERIVLGDLPYVPTVYEHEVMITRTDTWHGYLPSPVPAGSPFGTSWLQLTALAPGPDPAVAAARATRRGESGGGGGPPWIVMLLVGVVAGSLLTLLAQRGRRGEEPLEWPEV